MALRAGVGWCAGIAGIMSTSLERGRSVESGERATCMKEKYIHVRATKQNSKASSSFLVIDLRRPL
eukprot:scaffold19596_cov183-Skeletonema_menzelii.AAC.2